METLCETLDVLASHEMSLTQYTVCLAMEESEKNSEIKAQTLVRLYQDHFKEIIYSIHPINLPGEVKVKQLIKGERFKCMLGRKTFS